MEERYDKSGKKNNTTPAHCTDMHAIHTKQPRQSLFLLI